MAKIFGNNLTIIWLVSFLFFLISFVNRRLSTFISTGMVFFCFLLAGFRSSNFPDYSSYLNIFHSIQSAGIFSSGFIGIHGEVGFKVLVKLIYVIIPNSTVTMLILALISCAIFLKICYRYSLNVAAVWLVYFSNSFLLKDLAQIRNSTASLLVVLGLFLLGEKRRKISAYGSFLFASIFYQYFALSGLVVGFLKKRSVIFLSAAGSVVLYFLLNFETLRAIVGNVGLISHYAGTVYVQSGADSPWPAVARVGLVLAFSLLAGGRLNQPVIGNLIASLIMAILCYVAFSGIPILAHRLGGYFVSVDAFIIAIFWAGHRKRIFVSAFLVAYSAAIFFYNIHSRSFLFGGYESILW